MKVLKPDGSPYSYSFDDYPSPRIFLAGSIEMGKAEDWQTRVAKALDKHTGTILNPRRDDWDSTWEQSIDNPEFKAQVDWELDGINDADYVVIYLQPGTQSPISLLELGILTAHPKKVAAVCCPEGFWRKGNVDIVCERYSIKVVETVEKMIEGLEKKIVLPLNTAAKKWWENI